MLKIVDTPPIVDEQNAEIIPVEKKKKKVSFSQYSKWLKCPNQYYLDYILGHKKIEFNLSLFFGTAMHFALQTYLETLYTKGVDSANLINVNTLFETKFKEEIEKEKTKFTYTEDEYKGYVCDGEDIIEYLLTKGNRERYFPKDKYEFIGVEIPLDMEILNNVNFIAYVDLILKDKITGKIKIYDFKTAAVGWNNYMKEDEAKYSQILLYKAFYSKKFNIPLSQIEIEFFILKRKLYEGVSYPQSRIQTFEPNHSHNAIADALNGFIKFVKECFTVDGEYNKTSSYPKIPGKAKKNCKYCGHYKTTCDAKPDKIEQFI